MSDSQSSNSRVEALRRAVREIEGHVARHGWDQPLSIFSLVTTRKVLESDPQFAAMIGEKAVEESRNNPDSLTVVEQEGLPSSADLEDLLGQLAWPEEVDGVAITVERIVVPTDVEEEANAISDAQEQIAFVQSHPRREDVRIAAGVMRSGENWVAIRSRSRDRDDSVIEGQDLIPDLVAALAATFE